MNPDDVKLFEEWGQPLPERKAHGTDEDIRANLKAQKPKNWRMEGNRLIADTDMGVISQPIPTDRILIGTNSAGLPIFRRVKL